MAEARPGPGSGGPGEVAAAAAAGEGTWRRRGAARPGDSSDIIGDPIGREGLMVELAAEMIPYTPEELIALDGKSWPGAKTR